MKKILGILMPIIIVMCVLTGCMQDSTTTSKKSNYQLGEKIKIYDNETEAYLGEVTVTNVRIISSEPYKSKDYLMPLENLDEVDKGQYGDRLLIDGDSVYLLTEYNYILQIDYTATSIDSAKKISKSNFDIKDFKDRSVDRSIDVEYESLPSSGSSFAIGIFEKGDIELGFSYHSNQKNMCTISCEFDEETDSYIVANTEDDSGEPSCIACNKPIDENDKYCKYCGEKQ